MKKSSLYLWTIAAASAVCILSCKKNNDVSAQQNNNSNSDAQVMTEFMQNNGPQFESFTVDATAGAIITSSKGITYSIPGGAFVTQAGATVTGSVTVSVKEINSASDMLLGDKPTLTSDGRMLVSYGEFFVAASQNNLELLLKKDSTVKVQVPAKRMDNGVQGQQGVPLWAGDSIVTTTLSGYDWLNTAVTVGTQTAVRKGIVWDQISSAYAFFNSTNGTLDFGLDSLVKWRNCDLILSNPNPKTTVLCYFDSNYNNRTTTDYMGDQPTMLYFKPHNQNMLIKFYDIILNATGANQGFISYEGSVPESLQGTFLAISTINGKFYADMQDVTIGAPVSGQNYTSFSFNPQEVSESVMLSMIAQLNTK